MTHAKTGDKKCSNCPGRLPLLLKSLTGRGDPFSEVGECPLL